MALLNYIQTQLANDIANHLNDYENEEHGFPNIQNYYSPYGWFYEDTIRAVTYQFLSNWLVNNGAQEQYLILAEQPYPNYPVEQWVDIMIVENNDDRDTIFVEIKADFNLGSVEEDMPKLEQAYHNIKQFQNGFAIYCVQQERAGDWAQQLKGYQSLHVKALAIIKQ